MDMLSFQSGNSVDNYLNNSAVKCIPLHDSIRRISLMFFKFHLTSPFFQEVSCKFAIVFIPNIIFLVLHNPILESTLNRHFDSFVGSYNVVNYFKAPNIST
jgi:hypothetical protein